MTDLRVVLLTTTMCLWAGNSDTFVKTTNTLYDMNIEIDKIALEFLDVVAVIGGMWYSLIFPL